MSKEKERMFVVMTRDAEGLSLVTDMAHSFRTLEEAVSFAEERAKGRRIAYRVYEMVGDAVPFSQDVEEVQRVKDKVRVGFHEKQPDIYDSHKCPSESQE